MLMRLNPSTKQAYEQMQELGLITFNASAGFDYLTKNGVKPLSRDVGDVETAMERYAMKLAGTTKWNAKAEKTFHEMATSSAFLGSKFYDQQGNLKNLSDISGILNDSMKDLTNQQRSMALETLFGSDAVRGANILFKEGAKGVDSMAEAMSKISSNDVAKKKMDNLKGSVEELSGSFETAVISVGEIFLPVIEKVVAAVQKIIDKFNESSPAFKTFVAVVAAVVAAVTGVITVFGVVLGIVGMVVSGIGALVTVFGTVSAAITQAGGVVALITSKLTFLQPVLAALTGPIGLVVAAIVGFIAVFVIAYQKVDWFRQMVDEVWAWISENTLMIFNMIKESVLSAISGIVEFGSQMLDKFRVFWDENGASILSSVQTYFQYVVTVIKSVMAIIFGVFQVVWPQIQAVVEIVWAAIRMVVSTAINLVLGIIQTVMKLLQGDWKGAWESIKKTAENIWNDVVSIFKSIDLLEIGKDVIRGFIKGISSMVNDVKDAVTGLANKLPDWVKKPLGIHSPSRVFMELGEFTNEGFIKGIESTTSQLKNAVTGAYDKMAVSARNIVVQEQPSLERTVRNNSAAITQHSQSQSNNAPSGPIVIPIVVNGRELARATFKDVNELIKQAENRNSIFVGG